MLSLFLGTFAVIVLAIAFGVPAAMAAGIGTFLFALGVFGCLAQALGQRYLLNLLAQEVLYLLEAVDVGIANKGDSLAIAIGTGRTPYTVHIILGIVGHIEIDNGADIVDIDTSGHNIGRNKHIDLTNLEAIHHLVALLLRQVAMHLVAIDVHRLERTGNLFDALLLTREDDDALKVALLEDMVDNLELLRVVAHVGTLMNLLGWFRHSDFYLDRIMEQINGQLADFGWHRS